MQEADENTAPCVTVGENVFVKCKVLFLHVTSRHKQVLAHHNHTHSPLLPVILFV